MIQNIDQLKGILSSPSYVSVIRDHMPPVHTHSSISMYQKCEHMWFYRYVLGLTTRRTGKPLVVGTLMHLGMELALERLRLGAVVYVDDLLKSMETKLDEIAEKSDMLGGSDSEMLEYCRVQASAMVAGWVRHSLPRLQRFDVLEVEHTIRLPITSPLHSMGGKIDGIVRAQSSGRVYVLEHKSRSSIGTIDTGVLSLDQQANWYMDAYQAETGTAVDGFLYDLVQKPLHKMSAKGSDELQQRMEAAMDDNPEKYFDVVDVIGDRSDRQRNLSNMLSIVERMEAATPATLTRNTASCTPYGAGSSCPYRALCSNRACSHNPASLLAAPLHQYDIMPPNTELAEEPTDV